MIRSFRDRATKQVWLSRPSRRLPPDIQALVLRRLRGLDTAERLDDLRQPPGNRLEALSGDRQGQHSIRINQQWRICFRWTAGGCDDVEICDYH
ncbi:MAG: type II toxin-antitoxin system RelE/ParE family toxin [Brevundimonas sp.]|jgi:proteic killer suppression protein|uniref:type II toxin-antitoxin system RelE/ParE family toxin n=1 Tax=Brevundimonas sp. TaxID=1871086 RepID=UPI00391DA2C6